MGSSTNSRLEKLYRLFHRVRATLLALSAFALALGNSIAEGGGASLAVTLAASFFLIVVALQGTPKPEGGAVGAAATAGTESFLAAVLPPPVYALWAPLALIPHLFSASVAHGAIVTGGVALGTGTAFLLLRVESGALILPEVAIATVALGGSLLVVLFLRGWKAREERRREELLSRLETRNTMLSTLAHEVRTPLTVLQTSSALMLEERPGTLTGDQRRLMQQIDSGVSRLIHFSDNLIASIKVDQGWFSLDLRPVDLRKVIKGVAEHVQPLLTQRKQELKMKFPSLLSRVPGDRQWLEQVMVNLIHNAAKYAEPGGLIDIAVRENEQWVVVSIGDNGAGISGDERFQVFSEFYQANHWGASQLNGSGLGLAIVKRVVERHGGEVYVGSVENIGTIISFTLPKDEALHE